MMLKKKDLCGSRDLISGLPDPLIGHILSFLPTKEAASTSLLSTKWRYLFALVSNLDIDDSAYLNSIEVYPSKKSLMDFVKRVLALQGKSHVHKFSLKITDDVEPVAPNRIYRWIRNVLKRGVSDLSLHMDLDSEVLVPPKMFLCKTLFTLKLHFGLDHTMDVEDVDLPKLKTLHLSVDFKKHGIGLAKLLYGCHMLEDLVLNDILWFMWDFAYVSVTTLKRLTFRWEEDRDVTPKSVSIDTPNLVYIEFTDTIAEKYPRVNFASLVEAKIDLRMSGAQTGEARFKEQASLSDLEGHEENNLVGNATHFIMGISNVKILYLCASTLEVRIHDSHLSLNRFQFMQV